MKLLIALAAGLLLSGCVVKDAVRAKAADAFDSGLQDSEAFICNDASIGSVKRRYGRSSERARVYEDFCSSHHELDITK